jgi:GTPase SAR1 family protein
METISNLFKSGFNMFLQLNNYRLKHLEDELKKYTILIVVENQSGKSFFNRFINNEFNLEIKPNNDITTGIKKIKFFEETLNIELIDVDNMNSPKKNPKFYEDLNINGVFVLYDITKYESFEKVDNWVKYLKLYVKNNTPFVICGNKNDLIYLKQIHSIELEEKALTLNCDFIEVSCTDGQSIDEAVKCLVGKIYYLNLPPNKQKYLHNLN